MQPSAYALSCESRWQYQGLIALLKLGQIDKEKLANIIKMGAKEVLFDLLQANFRSKISFRSQSELFFERPEVTVVIDDLLADAQVDWEEWHKQKLGSISPNKARSFVKRLNCIDKLRRLFIKIWYARSGEI